MKKRFLTILVLPSDSSTPRRYSISMKTFKGVKIISAAFCVLLAYILVSYGWMSARVSEVDRLRKENTAQKIELHSISAQLGELETKMAQLKTFDKKLRMIANIEKPVDDDGEPLGMGGTTSGDDYFLTVEDKRGQMVDRMRSNLDQLELEVEVQEKSFTELQEFLLEQSSILASTPSVLPTRGWVTSSYGKRTDPFTGLKRMHKGLDVANRVGTPVIAPADGIVTRVTSMPGLGKVVEIKHGYGIKTLYGHLSQANVKVGQKVKRGDEIAAMGNTGRSTGAHLHYEVTVNGINVNPSKYVLN